MSQRMRTPLSAGRFSEAVDEGVLVFVSALAEKHGLAVRDLDKPAGTAETVEVAEVPTATEQSNDPPVTRPRVVKETTKPSETETTTQPAATEPQPTTTETTSQRTPTESTPQPIPTDTSQPATAESTPKPTIESAPESTAPKTKQTETNSKGTEEQFEFCQTCFRPQRHLSMTKLKLKRWS